MPSTNKGHDEYNAGRQKTLMLNDVFENEFDILTYSDMLFWIELYNRQLLEGVLQPKVFPAGSLRNEYQYDAFGSGLNALEVLPNRIRYTGQQYDDLTGQYYIRARYYNPVHGRFVQEDVYQGDGLNLYVYIITKR